MEIEFQNKKITRMYGKVYWFRFGRTEFDIRMIRAVFKRKRCLKIDTNLKVHSCTRFEKMIQPIIELVGDEDFKKIIIESEVLQVVEQRKRTEEHQKWLLENPKTEDEDDLPF